MIREDDTSLAVLVVEDVTETRDGIEKLLKADGYRVAVARDERDAIESARLRHPDLILVSLAGFPSEVIFDLGFDMNLGKIFLGAYEENQRGERQSDSSGASRSSRVTLQRFPRMRRTCPARKPQ